MKGLINKPVDGVINGGGELIHLKTVNGSIRLKERKAEIVSMPRVKSPNCSFSDISVSKSDTCLTSLRENKR